MKYGKPKSTKKVAKVMGEFKKGSLKSSSGQKVTNQKQAVAIGMSEQRETEKKRKRSRTSAA